MFLEYHKDRFCVHFQSTFFIDLFFITDDIDIGSYVDDNTHM